MCRRLAASVAAVFAAAADTLESISLRLAALRPDAASPIPQPTPRSLAALEDAAAAVSGGAAVVGIVLALFATFLALQGGGDGSDAEDSENTTTTTEVTEVYAPPTYSMPRPKHTQQPRYDPATGMPTYLADESNDGGITRYIKVTLSGDGGNRPKGDSTINRYG